MYDDNQNITRITDYTNYKYSLNNLSYDGLDRLTSTIGSGSYIGSSQIEYDGLGNITYYQTKDKTLDYQYNTSSNLLTSVSGYSNHYSSFNYDDRGNVTYNGKHNFTYNKANQMVSSGENTYLYDGFNRRVKETDSKGTSYSLYSQSGTLYYRESQFGGVNYIYLGDKLIAKDGISLENAGTQHSYPFGESIEGAINDVGYTGHKFDTDLGLSYMQARYYDPVIGRFYANDPVGTLEHLGGLQGIQGFNRYVNASNNPYKYIDPDGREGEDTSSSDSGGGGETGSGGDGGIDIGLGGIKIAAGTAAISSYYFGDTSSSDGSSNKGSGKNSNNAQAPGNLTDTGGDLAAPMEPGTYVGQTYQDEDGNFTWNGSTWTRDDGSSWIAGVTIQSQMAIARNWTTAISKTGNIVSLIGLALTVSVVGAEIGLPLMAIGGYVSYAGDAGTTISYAAENKWGKAGGQVVETATSIGVSKATGGLLNMRGAGQIAIPTAGQQEVAKELNGHIAAEGVKIIQNEIK